jgi:CubicO group peptidase (beta-lactamase class C family)
VLEFAGGLSNRQTGRANRLDTRFATASVSKMFTAVCIARLVDAGLCRFDQPLVEIVPMLRPHFDAGMSLESLLSHRSGLGDYLDEKVELLFAGMDVARLDCPQAFLPHVLRAPRGPVGKFQYSSAGFILLGLAIEALTGEPFPSAIAKWVTEPAGLRSTGFPSMNDPADDLAVGYLSDGRPNIGHLPPVGGADGGIVTNVEDMRRFFNCLAHEKLISEPARQFLWQEVSRISDWEAYFHGFNIVTACGRSWYGHTGSDPGVSARVAFSMQPESSIIVLCNCGSVAFRVFQLVLEWLSKRGLPLDEEGLTLKVTDVHLPRSS